MKIFKQLNKKGYKHYYEGTVEELDSMDKDNQHLYSEIMQVIMWLYEKYGVWIHVDYYNDGNSEVIWFYNYKTVNKESMDEGFKTPEEAYEAAIEYTLNKLI